MVVLTCWQVFTRYVLQNPSSWSEELVSYLFAWASLLGASLVTGERGHMNIPILVEKCSPLVQKLLNILGELVAFAFSAIILVYGGIEITQLAMGQMTSSLGVQVGIFYVVMPLCGVLNMVYTRAEHCGYLQGQHPAGKGGVRDGHSIVDHHCGGAGGASHRRRAHLLFHRHLPRSSPFCRRCPWTCRWSPAPSASLWA